MRLFPILHRSRVRMALTLIFAFVGLAVAVIAALSAWYASATIASLVESAGLPDNVGAANTLAATSLVLACLGITVALVPLPWHSATQTVQPLLALPAIEHEGDVPVPLEDKQALPEPIMDAPFRELNPIPPISVYVDAENKSFSIPELKAFFRLLDTEIGNQHADRFYYFDAKQLADKVRDTYQTGGFTLRDVPHKAQAAPMRPVGAQTVNAVDIAMALDILERALLGPKHQTIILITADRDYFPLLSRLKGWGHEVRLWARSPDAKFLEWCTGLGISVVDLDREPSLRIEHLPRKKR